MAVDYNKIAEEKEAISNAWNSATISEVLDNKKINKNILQKGIQQNGYETRVNEEDNDFIIYFKETRHIYRLTSDGQIFYLGYSETITITFDSNGGVISDMSEIEGYIVTETETIKLVNKGKKCGTLPTVACADNSIFDGWYTERTGGKKITEDTIINFSADSILYARFTENIDLSAYTIQNGSFESPIKYDGSGSPYAYVNSSLIEGWKTTGTSQKIELAWIKNNTCMHFGSEEQIKDSILPSQNQFAEINASEKASIFQNIKTTERNTYNWSLYHRGRTGREVMALIIGDEQTYDANKASINIDDQFNDMIEWVVNTSHLDLQYETKMYEIKIYSPKFNSTGGFEFNGDKDELFSYSKDNVHTEEWDIWIIISISSKWYYYSGEYTAHAENTTFALCSVLSSKLDDLSYGNLIDGVSLKNENTELIENGSFENVIVPSDKFFYQYNALNHTKPTEGIGWMSTATNKKIEVCDFERGKDQYKVTIDYPEGLYVKDGQQFIEINETEEATIYQNFLTQKEKEKSWSFTHRGREGIDYMAMILGPAQKVDPSKANAESKDQFMKIVNWLKSNIDLSNYGLDYKNEQTGCSNKITVYTAEFSENGEFDVSDNEAVSLTKDYVHTEEWNVWIVGSNNDKWYTYGYKDLEANYDYTYTNNRNNEKTIMAFVNYSTYGYRYDKKDGTKTGNLLDYVSWK